MSGPPGVVKLLSSLYETWSRSGIQSIVPLPASGSYRRYYRIYGDNNKSVIGAYNIDERENNAFVYLARHLLKTGNSVPEIFTDDLENRIYLQEDLGSTTLLDYVMACRQDPDSQEMIMRKYRNVIDAMPGLQIRATEGLDTSVCYPRAEFDEQSMMWDLNYFKYNLLKPLKIHFYEQDMEDDFHMITQYLCEAKRESFMFRDFQARNIMLHQDRICFIDFQGGRKGPLQYDLASLLFEAKTSFTPEIREELLTYYLQLYSREFSWFDQEAFLKHYYGFVYLRLMQAMGAYGFRGLAEHKPVFLQSLPLALLILEWLLEHQPFPVHLKCMPGVFTKLLSMQEIREVLTESDKLTVTINSFSYRNGIPEDRSGNGGGFVFDCRALKNPGRLDKYKNLTGLDKSVIDFLENNADTHELFSHTCSLVDQTVTNYIRRGFKNLSVSYGCTGGRHRSVYMVEKLGGYLKNNYRLNIVIHHTDLF